MENQIAVISEQKIFDQKFRIFGTLEEPLFLAADVAKWLGHSNPTMMIRKVDEDEKKIIKDISAGGSDPWVLTENGVYEVLMQSRKPIAKQFKAEVKKILHELRIQRASNILAQLPNFSNPAEAARAWADQYEGRIREEEAKREALIKAELAERHVAKLQPKADYVDTIALV